VNVRNRLNRSPGRDDALGRWLLVVLLSAAPVVFGTVWGIRHDYSLDDLGVTAAGGFMYTAVVPASEYRLFDVEADTPEHPRRALTELFENGRRLGPAHEPREDIQTDSPGRFSHWGSTLYFSTSDNSDPRSNGRSYTVATIATLSVGCVLAWALCGVITASLTMWTTLVSRGAPRSRGTIPAVQLVAATLLNAACLLSTVFYSRDTGAANHLWLRSSIVLPSLWSVTLVVAGLLAWQAGQALGVVSAEVLRDWREHSPDGAELTAWIAMQPQAKRLLNVLDAIQRPFSLPGLRGALWRAASLSVAFAAFAVALELPLPRSVLFASYTSLTAIALPAGLLLWFSHLRRDWLGTVVSLTLTLCLFALPLAALWRHVGIHYSAVGGLLPWSDASGYYYDARRLAEGHLLGWTARRPLYVGALATVLALTGQNLQVTLASFVALNGIACFLLAREVRFSHGATAAALVTMVLFLFYRKEGGCGTTLTENLGFSAGTLGFAVLWRGMGERRSAITWIGLGLLTIGLLARAGAFLVLPALVAAGAWVFRDNRRRITFAAGAIAVILLVAASLTFGLGRLLADPASEQTAFSNFSYSLYGLVTGGKGWMQVLDDHPEAHEGAEIYALAFQAFRTHPMGLVHGSLAMWRAYLGPNEPHHAFGFVRDVSIFPREGPHSALFQTACYALSAIGLAQAVRRRHLPRHVLLAAAAAGHLISIPFVPPIDAGFRVYAATMPILALLVAVGAAELLQLASRRFRTGRRARGADDPQPTEKDRARWPVPAIVGVAMALGVVGGPLGVYWTSHAPAIVEGTCTDGSRPLFVRFTRGSSLRVGGDTPDVDDTPVVVPDIRRVDLRTAASGVEVGNTLDRITAGNTMMNSYDLKSGRFIWLIAPTALLPGTPGMLQVCGHEPAESVARQYGMFYAHSVQRLSSGAHLP
jgi:hypothetical protein